MSNIFMHLLNYIFSALLLFPTFTSSSNIIQLDVPFVSEVPDGSWVAPWNNACEEASMVMVEQYYLGKTEISKRASKNEMTRFIRAENRMFGYNANTTATETAKVINETSVSFNATVKRNPTLAEIKKELDEGRPVISLHHGRKLQNPLIPFRRGGSYYHMMVIIGYDDAEEKFIVNDDGNDKSGENFKYRYDIIMKSLRDYIHRTKKTDGPPTVLFTYPRLVKVIGTTGIYFLQNNKRHYVTHPRVFRLRDWRWDAVREVAGNWLNSFATGTPIYP